MREQVEDFDGLLEPSGIVRWCVEERPGSRAVEQKPRQTDTRCHTVLPRTFIRIVAHVPVAPVAHGADQRTALRNGRAPIAVAEHIVRPSAQAVLGDALGQGERGHHHTFVDARPTKQQISLRLEPAVIVQLKKVARTKGVGYQTLILMWVMERLEQVGGGV